MCGIFGAFNIKGTYHQVRALAYKLSRRQRHRGPDLCGILITETKPGVFSVLCQERLTITDLSEAGRQPFELFDDPNIQFCLNCEIYNYPELRQQLENKYVLKSHADSEIAGILYKEYGPEKFWDYMEGAWALILHDKNNGGIYIGRDHIGLAPLYIGFGKNGEIFASSEMKSIQDFSNELFPLQPGHYLNNKGKIIQWYKPQWQNIERIPTNEIVYEELRNKLIQTVKKEVQLGSAPFGLFLSGGIDSSVIAGIVVKLIKKGEIDISQKGMTKLHSFSVGLNGSSDLHYAQILADFLGTEHHSYVYTIEEGIDSIPECIYHTETYDDSQIRSSVPLYQMCRRIKSLGIKVCISGDGSDEIFGGYLYFHRAPNKSEFHQELVRKVKQLHSYELLRTNKCCFAWGIEPRAPYLNKQFLDYIMNIDPQYKMPQSNNLKIEKYILRKAFDTPEDPFVPNEILWRQKEQFSDGVGYQWSKEIKNTAEGMISDLQFDGRFIRYPFNTPQTKEQQWYREIFEEYFPTKAAIATVPEAQGVACMTLEAEKWDQAFSTNHDPSGKIEGIHKGKSFYDEMISEQCDKDEHFFL